MFNGILNSIKKLSDQINRIEIKVAESQNTLYPLYQEIEKTKINSGKSMSIINQSRVDIILEDIHQSEFQVFSQFGDDGIIQFLTSYLDIDNKVFVEFGVENYKEANTRFLLINNNWTGLVIDGSKENIKQLQSEEISWKYDIRSISEFITAENINNLIESNGISGDIGLLHIDIDGNDYWVWKEISIISPVVAIIEYNSVFGDNNPWTIPYDKTFNRTEKHFSNLYFGTSLLSLCDLAKQKGYIFIGCNSNGNNAYFVRKDKAKKLKPLTTKNGYVLSKFKESRNEAGQLSYLTDKDRFNQIIGLPIYNTVSNKVEKIK